MADYRELSQTEDEEIEDLIPKVYHTYKRRWFYLFVVCLAQISNAIVSSNN
jgi:hypothetical protein